MTSSVHQPSPRFGHSAVQVQEQSFLWGGWTQDFSDSSRSEVINIFDSYAETWKERITSGDPPPSLYYGASTLLCDNLYSFGGLDDKCYYNCLHKLHLSTQEWRKVLQHNPAEGPPPKMGCGVVAYRQQLAVIGGGCYTPTDPLQSGAEFIESSEFTGRGWTNEFHLFSIKEGKWSSPPTTGPRPPPSIYFSFTALNDHKAVMFGGFQPEHGRVSDVYIIDFNSMEWTKLERPDGAPWPVGRDGHAACCLSYEEEHPFVLMTGGVDKNYNTLGDVWLLDIHSGRWRELTPPEGTQPRHSHSLTSFMLDDSRIRVTAFGGGSKWGSEMTNSDIPKLTDTTVLEFGLVESPPFGDTPSSRQWDLVGVADSSQLGTPERTRELEQGKTEHASSQGKRPVLAITEGEGTTKRPRVQREPLPGVPVVVIEKSDLEFDDELGGEVYKARWKSRNMTVAVKRLTGRVENGEACKLESLRHRNIIRFYGVVIQKPEYWMVTEYAENGSLFGFLQQSKVDLGRDIKWAMEIAQGLHYLHHEALESIIHGDLKSRNVVLTSEWTAKICDFGSARKYYHTTTKTIEGTYPWTAPEVIEEKQASISCDIFSYGMVLWELVTHQKPFDGFGHFKVATKIVNGERPPIPATCPLYLKSLITQCWQHDPKERPGSSDIVLIMQRGYADPCDLAFLVEQLQPVTSHWKDLGLQLGLTLKELKTIENMPLLIPSGPAACLREMLDGWLNQAPPSHPLPTITKLCDALRSHTVGEERVAYDLEQQYWAQKTGGKASSTLERTYHRI